MTAAPIIDRPLAEIPSSTLAWVGDAVHELRVRLHVLGDGRQASGRLHRRGVVYSSAVWQAAAMQVLLPQLSEEEEGVYRRGRNHAPSSVAKNAPPQAYRMATGFEALIGYLHLAGREARIDELLGLVWELEMEEMTR